MKNEKESISLGFFFPRVVWLNELEQGTGRNGRNTMQLRHYQKIK